MIRSMTGFGRVERSFRGGKFQIEIRSLNHRFLEVSSRLPENLLVFEDRIRAEVTKRIKRGKVNLSLSYASPGKSSARLTIDKDLARTYKRLLLDLKRSLKLSGEVQFSHIISFPDVITMQDRPKEDPKIWPYVKSCVIKALDSLVGMRQEEGRRLTADIIKRQKKILKDIRLIEKRSKFVLKEYRLKLLKKIKDLSSGKVNLDKGRIELEIALFAKNSDISEELTRLKAHLKSFEQTLKQEEVGRKLDFIAQEIHREINTVGQKTGDFRIAQLAIGIKGEVEKIREQIQNIE